MAQPDLRSGDGPVALILSPTRELAKQVEEVARLYGKTCHINSVAVYGGADKNSQISLLNKGFYIFEFSIKSYIQCDFRGPYCCSLSGTTVGFDKPKEIEFTPNDICSDG